MSRRFLFYSFIWLIIFSGVFIFLSRSIFISRANRGERAYGQLPLSGEVVKGADSIFISKIGLRAPIVFGHNQDKEDIVQDLDLGVVHWPETAYPGENSNAVLVGHSSGYFWQKNPYGRIFANLDKLVPGDEIVVFYNQERYLYQIREIKVVPSKTIEVLPDEAHLTLITCWPAGTTLKRLVVKAEMI